jgi:porin
VAERPPRVAAALACLLVCAVAPARAAPPPISVPITSQQGDNDAAGGADFLSSLQRSNFLLGNLFGLRTELSKVGISLAIQDTSEVLGNLTGGSRTGFEYDGLTQAILQLDTQRAFGFHGGLFNVSALQIHGQNLSAMNLLTLQTASGIEADRATRLWELWYDQKLLPEDRLDIKIGQQSLDQEFIVNPNGAYLINTMFGWPMVPSANLPGGGPAYPLSALGIRFRYRPVNSIAILAGVYNGSPTANNNGDAQQTNPSGTSFPLNGGTLTFVELQYSYPAVGAMVYPGQGAPLGHTYRIGGWYNSEEFNDLQYDTDGRPLASPQSNGQPKQHRGDYSLYAVADQMVWRKADLPNRSVSVFGRVVFAPQQDRNLISVGMNAGVVYHDPLPNRPDDTLAVGMGFTHVSSGAAGYDKDVAFYGAMVDPKSFNPIRTSETYIELTYQYQVHPWWQLQPDVQYVFNPGAGIANPNNPSQRLGDELVVGLRSNVLF